MSKSNYCKECENQSRLNEMFTLCDEHEWYEPLTDSGRRDLEVIQARASQ